MSNSNSTLHLLFLYVVYDMVAKAISGPVVQMAGDAVAIRMFSDAVLGPNSVLAMHPDDYQLVKVGCINTSTGQLIPLEDHEVVITARTIVDLANRNQDQVTLPFPVSQ